MYSWKKLLQNLENAQGKKRWAAGYLMTWHQCRRYLAMKYDKEVVVAYSKVICRHSKGPKQSTEITVMIICIFSEIRTSYSLNAHQKSYHLNRFARFQHDRITEVSRWEDNIKREFRLEYITKNSFLGFNWIELAEDMVQRGTFWPWPCRFELHNWKCLSLLHDYQLVDSSKLPLFI
jgi:hypothetical protein